MKPAQILSLKEAGKSEDKGGKMKKDKTLDVSQITAGKIELSPEAIKLLRESAEFWDKVLKPSIEEKKAIYDFYEKHHWLRSLSLSPFLGKLIRKICIKIAMRGIKYAKQKN